MKNLLTKLVLLLSLILFVNCSNDDDIEEILASEKVEASISVTQDEAVEPSTYVEFTIELSRPVAVATNFNLSFSGSATNGEDFEMIPNTVRIIPGESSVKIPVNILSDDLAEGEETLEITLDGSDNDNITFGENNKASLSITDAPEYVSLKPEDTRSFMVNPNATNETVALFYNLKTLSKDKFIVGQQDPFQSFYKNNPGESDIKKTTGYDPGMAGGDFLFITDDENDETEGNWFFGQEKAIVKAAEEAYNKGMVNAFSWHFREPYEGETFYTENMTEEQKKNAFASILPGGENHEYYKKKLQKIAKVTKSMVGNDGKLVPIIFRPFHEFDGDWFWWGESYSTPEQFIENWRFTVEYLRDDLGVDNMLFAFSPDARFTSESDYLRKYPGDDYVDVLGYDNYTDFENKGESGVNEANKKLQIISNLAKERVKIAALTETGYSVDGVNLPIAGVYSTNFYNALNKNDVEIAFMMFWSNSENNYYTPLPGAPNTADFIQFTRKDDVLLLNDLPNMYTMPNQ